MTRKKFKQRRHRRVSKLGKPFKAGRGKKKVRTIKLVRKKGKLEKENRALFDELSKRKNEVGGYWDFNEKGLENADIYLQGERDSLDIPERDYEIDFHTHPWLRELTPRDKKLNKANYVPSSEDIEDFLYGSKFQQTQVVLHDGWLVMVSKTPKTKNILRTKSRKEVLTIIENIDREVLERAGELDEKSFISSIKSLDKEYGKLGLKVAISPPKKAVNIPVNVLEER